MPLQPLGLNALLSPLGLTPLSPLGQEQLIQPPRPLGQAFEPSGSFQPLQPPSPLSPFLQTSLLENLTVDDGFMPSSPMVNPPRTRARFVTPVEDSQKVETPRSSASIPSLIATVPVQTSFQQSTTQEAVQRQPLGALKPLAQPSFQSPLEPERPSTMVPVSVVPDRVVQPTIVQPTLPSQRVQLDEEPSTTVSLISPVQPSDAIEHESPEPIPNAVSNTSASTSTIQPKANTPQRSEALTSDDGSPSSDSSQIPLIAAEFATVDTALDTSLLQPVQPQAIQERSSDPTTTIDTTRLESAPVAVSDLSSQDISLPDKQIQTRLEAATSVEPVVPDVNPDVNDETSISPTHTLPSNAVPETATPVASTPTIQPTLQQKQSASAATPTSIPEPLPDPIDRSTSEVTDKGPSDVVTVSKDVIQLRTDPSTAPTVTSPEANLSASETPPVMAERAATEPSMSSEETPNSASMPSDATPVMETPTLNVESVQLRLEAQSQIARAVNTEAIAAESIASKPATNEQTITPNVTPDVINNELQGSAITRLMPLQPSLHPLSPPTLSPPNPLVEPSNFLTSENNHLKNIQPSRTAPALPIASAKLSETEQTLPVEDESTESSSNVLPELQAAPEAWSNLSELIGAKPTSSPRQPLETSERLDKPTTNQLTSDETHLNLTDGNTHHSRLEPELFPFIQRSDVRPETRSEVRNETPDAWSDLSELIHKKPKAAPDNDSVDSHSSDDAFEAITLTSSSDRTSNDRLSDPIVLTSPIIQTAPQPQATAQSSQTGPVDEQKLEQLAHIVYRLMQTQFMVNQERRGGSCINPPIWSRNLILNNGGSATATATGQQAARASPDDVSLSDASLQTLTTEVCTQLQQRFEIDRERYGKLFVRRLS